MTPLSSAEPTRHLPTLPSEESRSVTFVKTGSLPDTGTRMEERTCNWCGMSCNDRNPSPCQKERCGAWG